MASAYLFGTRNSSLKYIVVWLRSGCGECEGKAPYLPATTLRVNSVEERLFHTQIVGGSTPSLSIQYFNIHRCVNILEVDILKNFENNKDEVCLECGTSELCGCNYSFNPDDETFDPYYDDVTDADDDLDDDNYYWSDSYDCGCCTCCGCTCSDDDWDDYYWNDYLDD